ncbi:M42 family metallopeptidase [Paenibacillus aurantius]|uniref:M42 family metallopeptidase n=1 Tax=Paenibacillus aurantius TaxID=2918900 RepID=A0AA96LBP3_9BACL|nr:M42 family metallopeptidase [Paenibacillus aurantius]WNQ09121.1 M42 family metallopeptidase [Paenibacillus aurantius]
MKAFADPSYVLGLLEDLLNIPSPTGYTGAIMKRIEEEAERLGLSCERTPKGMAILTLPGESQETLGLTAHVDTLGAMVRSVKENGRLRLTPLGGYAMSSIENEYVTIHTRSGESYAGTVLTTHPSVHVFPDVRDQKREEANMEVRIEADVTSRKEAEAMGIRVGDFVSFDPRAQLLENGWIRSRHLDDKAGVASVFGLLEALIRMKKKPAKTLKVFITNYEEVGHGAGWLPSEVNELLAVDMGAMGDDLTCTEKQVSICAKDSSGPYDYEMVSKLIRLADREGLAYAVDIYPQYSSDASAALRGGQNVKAALIGPGVHASHGMERTHREALWNTIALLAAYVLEA